MTNPVQYNPNVPENFSDSLDITQPDFLNNFKKLYDVFAENHVALDAGATAGNHTFIELITRLKSPQTDLGELSLYSKFVEENTNQLYMRQEGNQEEFKYTPYQIYEVEAPTNKTAFFTFLPGGLIVYFGTSTNPPIFDYFDLVPFVTKNVISTLICPIGTTPFNKPTIGIFPADGLYPGPKGIITKVVAIRALNTGLMPSYSYIIVGNT